MGTLPLYLCTSSDNMTCPYPLIAGSQPYWPRLGPFTVHKQPSRKISLMGSVYICIYDVFNLTWTFNVYFVLSFRCTSVTLPLCFRYAGKTQPADNSLNGDFNEWPVILPLRFRFASVILACLQLTTSSKCVKHVTGLVLCLTGTPKRAFFYYGAWLLSQRGRGGDMTSVFLVDWVGSGAGWLTGCR